MLTFKSCTRDLLIMDSVQQQIFSLYLHFQIFFRNSRPKLQILRTGQRRIIAKSFYHFAFCNNPGCKIGFVNSKSAFIASKSHLTPPPPEEIAPFFSVIKRHDDSVVSGLSSINRYCFSSLSGRHIVRIHSCNIFSLCQSRSFIKR